MSDIISAVEAFLANGGDSLEQQHEAALDELGLRNQEWSEECGRINEAALRQYERFLRKGRQDGSIFPPLSDAKGTE